MSDLLREILGDELEELLEDARENARESARMEVRNEQIHKMLQLKLPVNLIAQIAECSVAEVQAIAKADELNRAARGKNIKTAAGAANDRRPLNRGACNENDTGETP